MLINQALAANSRRQLCQLTYLQGKKYCLVGDGAYARVLLDQLILLEITLPCSWWVTAYQADYPEVSQYIDSEQNHINQKYIVLGTGHFQLEMIHRLTNKFSDDAIFLDLMLYAPKKVSNPQDQTINTTPINNQYLIYVDMYADINVPAYLQHFFEYIIAQDIAVKVHHPLESLSKEYIKDAESIIVWNGSTSAFVPLIRQLNELKIDVNFVECGFFPQFKHFYFDRCGVNNQSQLYEDDLSWVDDSMLKQLDQVRTHYYSNHIEESFEHCDYVFVPLQVPTDSNVLNHSRFNNGMQGFIDFIEHCYPNDLVIFKPHPKDRLKDTYQYSHGIVSCASIVTLISHSRLVHGINTSVLYEAVLMNKPVQVEGDCLLAKHQNQQKRLLAAMCFRQFSIEDKNFSVEKMMQFSFLNVSIKFQSQEANFQSRINQGNL